MKNNLNEIRHTAQINALQNTIAEAKILITEIKSHMIMIMNQDMEAITTKVKELTGIDPFDLSRKREIADIRHIAMWLIRHNTGANFQQIADHFGLTNHATVISALRKVDGLVETDREFCLKYQQILNLKNETSCTHTAT